MSIFKRKEKENIEIVNQREVKKQVQFVGKLTPQRGQQVWEFDSAAGTIFPVEPETIGVELVNGQTLRKLVMKHGCLYCCAINRANAERKFMKMINNLTPTA
jgi:hypothetical protein